MSPIRDHTRVLDDISQERLPHETNLLPGILNRIEKGSPPMKSATQLRRVALPLALILLFVLFALPATVSALKQFFGYIPGVGPVDATAPLRVLAEPVSGSRDGFAITVESALLDSAQTVIQYRIAGPFPARGEQGPNANLCQEYPGLRLANGATLNITRAESGDDASGIHTKVVFPALPAGQNQGTLVLPCVTGQLLGENPRNWEIPLRFAPAPPDLPVYPVQDLSTPLPAGKTPGADPFNLELEQMAEIPDGYYLKARLRWTSVPAFYGVDLFPDAVRVLDSAGQSVPIGDMTSESADGQSLSVALKIGAPANPGPLRVVVDYVALQIPPEGKLSLDVGKNPRPGQTWEVNQDVIARGYTLRVLSAEYVQEAPTAPVMLMLHLQAKPEVLLAGFADDETATSRPGGGAPNSPQAKFRSAILYEQFPKGKLNLTLSSLSVRRDGPWAVSWTPPGVDPSTPPRQIATPVTDSRAGFTLTVKSARLEASGSIVTYAIRSPYPFDARPGMATDACLQITKLRLASGREKISYNREGVGDDDEMEYTETFPPLPPTETPISLVISCVSGTKIQQGPQNWEIPLRFVAALPSTPTPLPSPTPTLPPGKACLSRAAMETALNSPPLPLPAGLGGQIAFWNANSATGAMFISKLDGSAPASLGAGLFPGLSPDGKQVVYRGPDNGLHVRSLPAGTDFLIPDTALPKVYNNLPVWSPDGKQIAFSRFAGDDSDVYIVHADGSNLDPVAIGPEQQSFLGWAADSRSIFFSVYAAGIHHIFWQELQTGQKREILVLPPGTTLFSLSPDGKRLVYGNDQGLFLTGTAHFAPTLLLGGALKLGGPLLWSPDGQWLALSYAGDADNPRQARLALLQPDTCQFILLQTPAGSISSWSP
jgi:hypothetical protein